MIPSRCAGAESGASGGSNHLDDDADEDPVDAAQDRSPAPGLGRHGQGHDIFTEVLDRRLAVVCGRSLLPSPHVTHPSDGALDLMEPSWARSLK